MILSLMNNLLPLEPPEAFISPLLELRDYYASLVKEYESLYRQARSQLDHVDALLSNGSSSSDTNGNLAKFKMLPQVSASYQEDSLLSVADETLDSTQSEFPESDNLDIDNFAATTTEIPESSTSTDAQDQSIKVPDIPMLPEYQHESRMEAIKSLLREHLGTVCHIDFIVRSLYGELEPAIFKVVKGRVQSSLTQGRERRVWSGIPDEPGCYTLNLSLVTSNKTKGYSQAGKYKQKKPQTISQTNVVPMLAEFEGLFLIDALSDFLEKHSGRIFSVAQIITGLYGELDEQEVREVKTKVLNELSRGYRTGRFSRVPEKIGYYTWDSKLMLETSRGR
ncbi:hypothetical protein PN465_09800 [Nodularia spumigena CS-584]|jgi:hypothetical protein|uniref:Uncharacterized protein n=2 Tax=Nodularia spumigena TaxID=70799 RepID=A0ABU5UPE2_NODSP|nr:hypothetical protein [Nodularia spumigena]AHJ28055.1 hypothetical protein NSP_17210 [Nodularia spumigena CCY9414]EAW44244.1 hypothetical protein N9414_12398 [Nodularia spumigena CCY9414]MDB9382515.1 hypothetical protein [Nodularia spumigena CS-584]MEA5523842.1 hypothetical protein [Nodularia spumigena UHCC 0143]MEA5555806.1 hypothetical protein [Nodularia spumigena CH309]